ncbi:MAG: SCO family protein [Candidatus Omnitrophica bacterium]|nr:SCO family protein [Candidatus Omnitrophota bacterium]
MRKRKFFIGISISVGILFAAFTIYSFQKELKKERLPAIGKVEEFSLLDQHGQEFHSRKLLGKVWIADFIFTTCSDICPLMTKNMASLSRTFEKVKGISLVSITVNPEYDTPDVLKKYENDVTAKADNWFFLSGNREDIRAIVIDSFKLGSIEEPIFHSGKFALVDRHGYIRGYYEGTETLDVNKLFKDAAELLKER